MAITLHEVTIAHFDTYLASLEHMLGKLETHCEETGAAVEAICRARLADRMWDFAKQVEQCCHLSGGTVLAAQTGRFAPLPGEVPPKPAHLRALLREARDFLAAISVDEAEKMGGNRLIFARPTDELHYVAKDFLINFAIPNFFFHMSMAYAILRIAGVPLIKMDFLGTVGPRD